MSPSILSPQLEDVKRQLLEARERVHRLDDSVSAEDWGRRPAEGQWSIAECVTHLNTTSERYLPLMDAAMQDGRSRGLTGEGPFRTGWLAGLFLRLLEPPYRLRVKTPPAFVPAAIEPSAAVLPRFDGLQGELLARLDGAAGLALDQLMVVSPFNARFKYNLYATFLVLTAHQRRHLWQGEQIRARLADAGSQATSAR
jgi:hypothetical protein